jgi:hypothetical protein
LGEHVLNLLFALAVLALVIWLAILLPAQMARERRRNPLIWIGISLVGSPLLAILLLLALGNAPDRDGR